MDRKNHNDKFCWQSSYSWLLQQRELQKGLARHGQEGAVKGIHTTHDRVCWENTLQSSIKIMTAKTLSAQSKPKEHHKKVARDMFK